MLRRTAAVAVILLLAIGTAWGQQNGDSQKKEPAKKTAKTSVALSVGTFFPSSAATRDRFSSHWTRVTLTSFEPEKPEKWRFTSEISSYSFNGPTRLRLYSLSAGVIRGLGHEGSAQPYLTFRAGPSWGNIKEDAIGLDESKWGLNGNVALGVVFNKRLYVEARYDVFSQIAGVNMNGFSITAGVKLFDIKW